MPCLCLSSRPWRTLCLVLAAGLGGCSTTAPPITGAPDVETRVSQAPEPDYIPVVRQGRYTLVELVPAVAQRDVLLQVIDVALPAHAHATVGQGLRHVLQRSGYQLCDDGDALHTLYRLPLPLAHARLGPMTLRDALLTLAGSAWAMQVDDRLRLVCFTPAGAEEGGATPAATPPPASAHASPVTGGTR